MPYARQLVLALVVGWLFVSAAPVRAASLDPRLEAVTRLYRAEGAEKALPGFEQLAREFERGSQTRDLAEALHYVGECHWRLGNFAQAHAHLDRALTLERASADRLGEGKTLNVLGLVSWDEGHYQRAIADFRKAGALARAAGDRKLEGSSLNNLSLVYDELGDYDTSLKQYQRVLELYQGANFPRGVGDTLGNIGGVHLLLGHFREALGFYQRALRISEELKSKTSMSQDHGNIALCLLGLGDIDRALAHLDQASDLALQAGMRQDQAYWVRVKGHALADKGRYDLALVNYRTALGVYDTIGAQAELVEALNDSGQLHLVLGDAASAERDFRRALELARTIGFERGTTQNLIALGDVALRRKQPDASVALYEQARQRAVTARQQHTQALATLRLARAHRALRQLGPATAETGQALLLARQIGAPGLEAEARYSNAELSRLQGRFDAALRDYRFAEDAVGKIGDPELLWQILLGRARAQESSGDAQSALSTLEAAVQLIEGVRGRLQEARFRSGYVEEKFEVYLELMRLQLQLGRSSDAFSTAERLRARSFVEQLGGRAAVPLSVDERRTETELRERVRALQRSLDETNDDGAAAYPERAMNRFSEELLQAEKSYQTFLDDHTHFRSAGGDHGADVAAVQRRLEPGEALLEYVVGPNAVVAFVLTSRGLNVKYTPLQENELAARISLLRDLVRHPGDARWQKPATRLSATLIEPLERAGWLDGLKRLYIVPHGALSALPFNLLPLAAGRDELLVDRYTIAYLPSAAALLRELPATAIAPTLLAVAPARGGLRHASEEARAIDALFRPNARALVGSEATEGRFKQLAGSFRMLHLATHGYFNDFSPLLSGLELEPDRANDGMLRVHEILDLPLQARLVTLSACDTALASGYFAASPAGDGFIGISRAFLAAGSASVMATLWQVDDRASVALMKQFYTRLNTAGAGGSAAAALASTQRAMRHSAQLAHPYYWAAYVVLGRMEPHVRVAAAPKGRTS